MISLGTWNSIWIGGLVQDFFSVIVEISSTSALKVGSVCPGNFLILQSHKNVEYSETNAHTFQAVKKAPISFIYARQICILWT